MNPNPVLSIVTPAYNEGEMALKAAEAIVKIVKDNEIPHEIIFVDDGSRDNTWEMIQQAAKQYPSVCGVRFSKNFGKESAILAGLSHARGDAVAVIDCDLQHPPEVLVEMLSIWRMGGVDIVEGVKESRGKESLMYKFFAKAFYKLIEKLGSISIQDLSDFQLLDRRVVDIILAMPERQRFFRALSSWMGFERRQVSFRVAPRLIGTSKFNFYKSTKYALNNITSFSSAPMQVVTFMGLMFLIAAIALGVHTVYSWIALGAVEGFTTVILLLLIVGSMLMVSMGIIGMYIGKIYEEIKLRPHYLVQELINLDPETPKTY